VSPPDKNGAYFLGEWVSELASHEDQSNFFLTHFWILTPNALLSCLQDELTPRLDHRKFLGDRRFAEQLDLNVLHLGRGIRRLRSHGMSPFSRSRNVVLEKSLLDSQENVNRQKGSANLFRRNEVYC